MAETIEAHNRRAAAVWSSGGSSYDEISRQIASALEHCVRRVDPQPGERILDLATGTGWTSRLLAECGAKVTGADIAADLLAAARTRAEDARLAIAYEIGDAEQLSFAEGSFDAVVSTFGVMFVSRPEAAAAEIARVCRKGGRICLATWAPQGSVADMFAVMRAYMPAPPQPSPFAWGDRARLQELLGGNFDLKFETGATVYYARDGKEAWRAFVTGYGPTKALAASLEEARRAQLEQDFTAFHAKFATPMGIAVPREYLLTLGTRR